MKRNRIDLHVHTTASDGTDRPEVVVKKACSLGLAAVAVTDHDTVDGVEEAMSAGINFHIEVVPGIEFSVESAGEMHILGYFPHQCWKDSLDRISRILKQLQQRREIRNHQVLGKLNDAGFNLTMEEVKKEAGGKIISRLHIASVMVRKGYEPDISMVFNKHIGKGCDAYVPKEVLSPEEGIQIIQNAGGLPVLAHPFSLALELPALQERIRALKSYGLAGIEAIYWEYSEIQRQHLLHIASENGLLVTGGSDYHGEYRSKSQLGTGAGDLWVDEILLQNMKESMARATHMRCR